MNENQRTHEQIARDAWRLYKQAMDIQQSILNLFFDDFITFDEQERQRYE